MNYDYRLLEHPTERQKIRIAFEVYKTIYNFTMVTFS